MAIKRSSLAALFAMSSSENPLRFSFALMLALLAGLLNVLSFAPFLQWPVQFPALALVFILSQNACQNWRQAGIIGWSYSFATLFAGVSWLLIAMTRYGEMPLALALAGLALLTAYLALFAGLALAGSFYLRQRWQLSHTQTLLLILPSFWCLSEYLRGVVFTGFPWLALGYAHTVSPLGGYAALFGVYGIGFLVAVIAGALALIGICGMSQTFRSLRFKMIALIALVLLSGVFLRQYAWTIPHGQPISVRLLQGNVDQKIKFDADHVFESLSLYRAMVLAAPADLIATPETALPLLSSQLPVNYLPELNQFAQKNQLNLMIGLGVQDGPERYSNSVLGFGPAYVQQAYRYDKHHLVPFGEFVPFGFRWFVRMLKIPLGDFSGAGLIQQAMQVKDQWVMANVCYEDLFGEEIAAQINSQIIQQEKLQSGKQELVSQAKDSHGVASILLNVSNLAWYGDSIAIPQHLQISQMRVLETGRPMLRSTNTGATALIRPGGAIESQLKVLTQATLSVQVQGMEGVTPYIIWGNSGIFCLVFLLLVALYWSVKKRKFANK